MRKVSCFIFAVLVFSFTSCDNFFSTSLGRPQKYDSSKMAVNAGNVDQWLESARGNSELTTALLDKIMAELDKGGISGSSKAKLMEAGIKLSVQSAGVASSIITHGSSVLQDFDNLTENKVTELLDNIIDDFNSKGGKEAAVNIAQIASMDIRDNGRDSTPQFGSDYRDTAKPGEVAEAILVLAMAELGPNPSIDNWNSPSDLGFDIQGGLVTVVKPVPSPNQVALAAYLNLITTGGSAFDDNPLTSVIKDAFNLI